jgi:FkbM family methyltransferase
VDRVAWLSTVTPNMRSALGFWLAAWRNPGHPGLVNYQGTDVVCRGVDAMAIKEVLVDREYAVVLPRLTGAAAPLVLDVGAHIGLFSLWLLKEYPGARVRSVEADPQTYDILARNVAVARSGGARWEAVNAAAWEEDAKEIRFSAAGPSMSHRIDGRGDIIVRGVMLKTLLEGLVDRGGAIDLMKIDIEGSEETFLCKSPELLRRVRNIVVELHPNLCNTQRVLDVLRDAYRTVTEVQHRASSKPLLLCY